MLKHQNLGYYLSTTSRITNDINHNSFKKRYSAFIYSMVSTKKQHIFCYWHFKKSLLLIIRDFLAINQVVHRQQENVIVSKNIKI